MSLVRVADAQVKCQCGEVLYFLADTELGAGFYRVQHGGRFPMNTKRKARIATGLEAEPAAYLSSFSFQSLAFLVVFRRMIATVLLLFVIAAIWRVV